MDELRERFGIPGMRILQFGFSDRSARLYLPHQYVPNTVAYTGTHDNNTTLGWWRDGATAEERANLQTYLQPIAHEGEIVGAMVRAAACSVAKPCIFPLQDILCSLGSEARMNTPLRLARNPDLALRAGRAGSRLRPKVITATLMVMTDRDGYVLPKSESPAAQ